MNLIKSIVDIIANRFGERFSQDELYFIAIQGASSSGKTTFASKLESNLEDKKINTFVINLDNFYKTADNPDQEDINYDFDNPESLRWDIIFNLIKALKNKDQKLPILNRRIDKNITESIEYIDNKYPNVVIIEGIFAFNCISSLKYNCDELKADDTFKFVSNFSVPNEEFNEKTKTLKIFLPLCKDKFKSVRIARDLKAKKPYNEIIQRFERMIWPDTEKFVYSNIISNDITVQHGNHNEEGIEKVLRGLIKYFTRSEAVIKEKLVDNYAAEFEKMPCSNDCVKRKENTTLKIEHNNKKTNSSIVDLLKKHIIGS